MRYKICAIVNSFTSVLNLELGVLERVAIFWLNNFPCLIALISFKIE